MSVLRHGFTDKVLDILDRNFGGQAKKLLNSSKMPQYLNIKTKAANRGSKSRATFANHYAIYVLVEDYLKGGFDKKQLFGL